MKDWWERFEGVVWLGVAESNSDKMHLGVVRVAGWSYACRKL